jgi:RNA polymerase sigma-70 factor (ECF subfamily)
MGLCRRYAPDRAGAQDCLQEAFIKIFNNLPQLSEATKLEPWAKAITVRVCISHFHRWQKSEIVRLETDNISETSIGIEGHHLEAQQLVEIIDTLPLGCKMVFNLYEIEGYKHSEIAELMGISVGSSRSQLNYAKELLKKKLNKMASISYEKSA